MNFHALADWKTTLPGLAVVVTQYLIANQMIPPQIGDIVHAILALVVGGALIGVNIGQKVSEPASALPAPAPAPAPAPEAAAPGQ